MAIRTINITVDDEEYERLDQVKGDLTWREFLLSFIKTKQDIKR